MNEFVTDGTTLVAISLLVVGIITFFFNAFSTPAPLYPGPKPLPLIGNALPQSKIWLTLTAWGKQYGPIYSLSIFRTPILVLNSAASARPLLEGKSAIYWNRPLPKMVELSGMDRGIVFQPDAAKLRTSRKLLHLILHPRELGAYRPAINKHVNGFLVNLLHEPDNFVQHIRNVTAGITLEMSHGYQTQGPHDPYVEMANITVQNFAYASRVGAHIVDMLPFIENFPEWLPGMGFKKKTREFRTQYTMLAERGHRLVKEEMAKGFARPSLTSKALEAGEEVDEEILMFTATQVYTGGADTSVSTLSSFILAMVRFPEVQERAQVEIDRVVGPDRLPSYTDRADLPYTDSLLKEILRCYPPIPAVIRRPSQDDHHDGHFISKNTTLIINLWAMLHDESAYTDADTFDPARWVGREVDKDVDPLEVIFGFGRRVCPGRYLAEEMLFSAIAATLATFDIRAEQGPDGKPAVPPSEYTDGGIIFPAPFRCSIQPRSAHAKEVIMGGVRASGGGSA